jgi:hypothetical protein
LFGNWLNFKRIPFPVASIFRHARNQLQKLILWASVIIAITYRNYPGVKKYAIVSPLWVTTSPGEVSSIFVWDESNTQSPSGAPRVLRIPCSLHVNDKLHQLLVSNRLLLGVIGDLLQAPRAQLEPSSIFMIWLFDPKKPKVVILTVVNSTSDVSKDFLTIT